MLKSVLLFSFCRLMLKLMVLLCFIFFIRCIFDKMKGKGKGPHDKDKEKDRDLKDCPLQFPDLTTVDHTKECPKYTQSM